MEAFGRFLDILDELRVKCPWDRKQTNESLRPNTIEETYELCDALMRDDKKDICKELGDVLLHVAFYAKIGSETGDFDIKDVCDKLCDKLIFRHPHVFGEVKAETAGQVSENWEQLKLKEKDGNKSVLSGVPAALPSLIKAYRIQDKARNVGFDWEEREQVWDKVKEEIGEFQAEVANMDKEKAEAEFGDVMFSLINAARLYKINPDNALELTNQKFIRRFNYLEEHTIKEGKNLKDMSLEEMDAIWNEAKKKGALPRFPSGRLYSHSEGRITFCKEVFPCMLCLSASPNASRPAPIRFCHLPRRWSLPVFPSPRRWTSCPWRGWPAPPASPPPRLPAGSSTPSPGVALKTALSAPNQRIIKRIPPSILSMTRIRCCAAPKSSPPTMSTASAS